MSKPYFPKIKSKSIKDSSSNTSWQEVGNWYDNVVGEKGHYYHQSLIIPGILKLLDFQKKNSNSILDIACGQGIVSRSIPAAIPYVGIDASRELIKAAQNYNKNPHHSFFQADATDKLPLDQTDFTHATLILALQNIENPESVFINVSKHLAKNASFVIVMNHPCFRIPRQSSWKVDQENKVQYRRIDRYMSPLKIPIQAHPGKGKESPQTWSFHHPLCNYSLWLRNAGFRIELIEEWCSNKVSQGGAAKIENRSREEIPLFMAVLAKKI